MQTLEISGGFVAIFDDGDRALVASRRWTHKRGYAVSGKSGKIMMHRLILGANPSQHVDHANGNKMDNRRCNIRIATRFQNMQNSKARAHSTTGLKGAHPVHAKPGFFFSKIQANGKSHYLGCFKSAEEAHYAYCKASTKMHAEFSRLE